MLQQRFLDPLGITPRQLARALGVRGRRIAELVAGRGRLTPDLALRLGLYLNVPARWWLDMQSAYDADDEDKLAELRPVVTPFEQLGGVFITPTGVHPRAASTGPSEPLTVTVTPEFVARLQAQVALNPPRPEREPVVVYLEDGRPMLTGR